MKGASERGRRIGGLSRRTAAKLAWSLCTVCVVLIMLALVLDFMTEELPFDYGGVRYDPGFAVLTGVLSLAYPTVGALIASRLPTNPIGWIFSGTGLLYVAQRFTTAYADYTLLQNIALPWGEYAAWFSTWIGFATPTLGVFLMLLFPGGRLVSRRWRIVAWVTVLGAAMTALGLAFMPGFLLTHRYVENPFGIVGVIGGKLTTYGFFGVSRVLGMTLLLMGLLAALFSVIFRQRHARGDERQQLKWFLFAAVPLTILESLDAIDNIVAYFTTDFMFNPVYLLYSLGLLVPTFYVLAFALLFVPVCTYIAILRHNLYDIDIIINRSIVYGALTLAIAGTFEAVDAVVHYFLLTFTHQEESIWSVIVAALAIAALFDPIKHRIRRFVDRRIFGEGEPRQSGQPERHPERGTPS
jgi:hypothetical protein